VVTLHEKIEVYLVIVERYMDSFAKKNDIWFQRWTGRLLKNLLLCSWQTAHNSDLL